VARGLLAITARMEALVLFSILLVGFSYVGYPLVLVAWDGLREAREGLRFLSGGPDRRTARLLPAEAAWPRVTIALSAHDEEAVIADRVRNLLALEYPADRLEILVGCDGCTDRTAALAREIGGDRVKVLEGPRSGKASVLSRIVPEAAGELVVFTDANTMMEPGALRALVRRFRDPAVGAVVGRLRLYNRVRREYEESLYWKYETALKFYEGKHGCVLGANGGIYAIRRVLFRTLEPDTIIDDFVIPVRIAARGWKVQYEPEAVAHEETTEDYDREFGRRARIGAGNWQALWRLPDLLDPRSGFLVFAFVSHKLLRWAAPFLLGAALLANVPLALQSGAWGWRLLLVLQATFYALAYAGRRGAGGRAASLAHYFVAMNAALAVGAWRFLRGTQGAAWDRTDRTTPARAA
jgi:cellulose synthase/poly-beta-1,6-N-acetylglucosamine synthase-like glycosyltransferase